MKIKKYTRTGTERSSSIDQMFEKIGGGGGGGGGARDALKIKQNQKKTRDEIERQHRERIKREKDKRDRKGMKRKEKKRKWIIQKN